MPRHLSAAQLAASIAPGERIFLAGSTGEPTVFLNAWLETPELSRFADVTTSFIPGVNRVAADRFHPTARLASVFPLSHKKPRQNAVALLPFSYFGVARALATHHPIDTIIAHVSPPDKAGRCSFGPAVEFIPALLASPKRIIAVYNRAIPALPGSLSIPVEAIESYCETDDPLACIGSDAPDATATAIAAHIATLVDDGAVLQLGLGKVPGALPTLLKDRRDLRFHSGLITDGMQTLAAAGALTSTQTHIACALLGSEGFYEWLKDRGDLMVRGCEETHHPARLAAIEGLIAVNSGLEVDLSGQVNVEIAAGRRVSAPGGAPDFAFAASHSMSGLSIIALPATTSTGHSRIVRQFQPGTPVGVPRQCVDVVVTEFGRADLRGLGPDARAEALTSIAHPSARGDLGRPFP